MGYTLREIEEETRQAVEKDLNHLRVWDDDKVYNLLDDIVGDLGDSELMEIGYNAPDLLKADGVQRTIHDFPHEIVRYNLGDHLWKYLYRSFGSIIQNNRRAFAEGERYVFLKLRGSSLRIIGNKSPEYVPFDSRYDPVKATVAIWNE